MTTVKSCNCSHDFQDQRYGLGKRLTNFARKAFNGIGGFRCTVCNKLHSK